MELWKKIERFADYEVSDKGNVRNVKTGKNLSKTVVDGKAKVSLTAGDKRSFRQVNQLVAKAFKPSLLAKTHTIVNKDGDPRNNSVENLGMELRANNKYHGKTCSEDGCKVKPLARGLCATHYHHWWLENAVDVKHRNIYEVVGYRAAHRRLTLRKGRADQFACQCGEQAEQWALLSMEADVLYKQINMHDRNRVYSLDPEDYEPMCGPCHRAYDKKARGTIQQRFSDCVEVSVNPRTRTSDHDYEALTEQMKKAKTLKALSSEVGVSPESLALIFQMVTGQGYREWKRQQRAAA